MMLKNEESAEEFAKLWQIIDKRLIVYGNPRHGNFADPLEELVYIILSAQTESYLYQETFKTLHNAFQPWSNLLDASVEEIAQLIRAGGLAQKKARQIKGAFCKIFADKGQLSLDFLHTLTDAEALSYLKTLPGIGLKSAGCIMLYSLGRQVFPVDTHVWRISRRLGISPSLPKPTEVQMSKLESSIPLNLRYRLHVNMLAHGREICTTYNPKCTACDLSDLCLNNGKSDVVWNTWRRPRGVWAKATQSRGV